MNVNHCLKIILLFGWVQCFLLCDNTLAVGKLKTIGSEAFEILQQVHGYDKQLPLDPNIISKRRMVNAGLIFEKIVLTSFDGTKIPIHFQYPIDIDDSVPCVFILHGLTGSKDDWVARSPRRHQLKDQLIAEGYAVAAIDARNHGERIYQFNHQNPWSMVERELIHSYQKMAISTIIDYSQLMDYLETREEIDSKRFGVIGTSMGGNFTIQLTAIDQRIKTAVSCVPPTPDWNWVVGHHYFAPYIQECPTLILMGNEDPFTTMDQTNELFSLIGSKQKDLIFYESGHSLPDEFVDDAFEWFEKHLK